MAAVSVGFNGVRVAEAGITPDTGTWGNDGGGGGVSDEPDIVYQGSEAQSRKVSTSRIGRTYTHGSGTDMTATNRRHWYCKINATNSAALLTRTSAGTGPALGVKMGSGSGAYHEYYLYGNENYPIAGGWVIDAISPTVSGYAAEGPDSGSPSDTSVLFWSVLSDFSASSKSENVCIDAIDIGAGLALTGGDGGDTDGVFQDFVDEDEGNSENRWGVVSTDGGIIYVMGGLWVGATNAATPVSTLTEFTDATGAILVWRNSLVETGFHQLVLDANTASTAISITGATFISTGENNNTADRSYTSTEDSRTQLTCIGSSGTIALTDCVFDNFGAVTLSAGVTISGGDLECSDLTQATADIEDGAVVRCNTASGVALCNDATFGITSGFNNMTFEQGGSGHAIEITSAGTYTWTNIEFTVGAGGFGGTAGTNSTPSSGANDAVVYNSSGGAVTINVSGGSTPSVRNAASSTTTVVATNQLEFTGLVDATEVRVYDAGTTTEIDGNENVFNGTVAFQIDPVTYTNVDVRIFAIPYIDQFLENIDMTGGDLSIPIVQIFDRNYLNPPGGGPESPQFSLLSHGFR